jgi:hypothetical protein
MFWDVSCQPTLDFESVEFFSTRPDRPIEILDLTGKTSKTPAGSVTEFNQQKNQEDKIS